MKTFIASALVAAAFAVTAVATREAQAFEPHGRVSYAGDLFYNFYVPQPPYGMGHPGQLYLCPRPTPPLVGHTYITYQPLMPHEFLYRHQRTYGAKRGFSGHNVTNVYWH